MVGLIIGGNMISLHNSIIVNIDNAGPYTINSSGEAIGYSEHYNKTLQSDILHIDSDKTVSIDIYKYLKERCEAK